MSRVGSRRTLRCLAVWVAVTLVSGVGAAGSASPAGAVLHPARPTVLFEDLLVGACALTLLVALGWLWCLTTLTVCQVLRDRAPRQVGATRRLLLLACGVAIATGAVAPTAVADETDRHTLAGLSVPDRAVSRVVPHPPRPRVTAGPARNEAERAVEAQGPVEAEGLEVEPGDSLWRIAQAHPVRGESIHRRWRAIWAANEHVIGPDPDLILPGQRFVLPDAAGPDATTDDTTPDQPNDQ